MNLLAAKLYDPAVAVNKATTAALAMTALDTTNLRLAITVPAHGMVRFRLAGTLHGATTMPQIMLGVMNGAVILGRVAPMHGATNIAATSLVKVEADFIVTGLTPGAMNVDAAYGVETVVASTGLKYGGPNNTTANDNFGGFTFEAWDPQPQTANRTLTLNASGQVEVGALAANVVTAASIAAAALNGKGDWNIGKTGYTLVAGPLDAAGTRAAVGLASANLDTQLASIEAKTTNLPTDPADQSLIIAATDAVMARLGAPAGASVSADVAAVKADTAAVKTKTDQMAFTVAGKLDANVLVVNGVTVTGAGTVGNPWGPA